MNKRRHDVQMYLLSYFFIFYNSLYRLFLNEYDKMSGCQKLHFEPSVCEKCFLFELRPRHRTNRDRILIKDTNLETLRDIMKQIKYEIHKMSTFPIRRNIRRDIDESIGVTHTVYI